MPARPRRDATDVDVMVHTLPGDRQADTEPREPEPQRSAVSLWRGAGRGARRWSVRVVAGTTEAELDELVRLAERAADRLEGGEDAL
jgi:hypothetical protein